MHPAYSVILFTTASGAGYGLLFLLGLAALFGLGMPETTMFGLTSIAISLGLISVGLLSSTFHLGHPERAWRAFSQWETSWLSREGVAAVATFAPAGLFALSWVVAGHFGIFWQMMGALSAIGAAVTVWCTGMIYGSLTPIRQWANPLVAPSYMLLALATGAVLFACLMHLFGAGAEWQIILAALVLVAAAGLKLVYFKQIDTEPRPLTPGDATGLGKFGTVRAIEAAHSGPNFVMREMGYKVARKHAQQLRSIFLFIGFGVTTALLLIALSGVEPFATICLLAAVATMAVGVVVERWLFFGEAQHVVTLYYGAEAA